MPSAPWKPLCATYVGQVSALRFDPYADLLWFANSAGSVVSHFLPPSLRQDDQRLERYTSFKSHTYRSSTTDLIFADRGILSLGDKSVKLTSRRALPHWYSPNTFQDANAMAFTAPKSAEFVVGGALAQLVLMNAANGSVVRKFELRDDATSALAQHSALLPITHIRRSQSLISCGSRSGTVTLRDPVTLRAEHSMMAHYAGLEQMETEGNYLVTCGFSLKQGHPVRDPLVKVFDIRALRPMAPITFPSIPALIRFHPRMPSTLFITSSIGQLQVLDLANPLPTSSFYQLDVSTFITDMSISNSGEGLAYSEADGMVHLWTTMGGMDLEGLADEESHLKPIKWTRGNQSIELPDPLQLPPKVDWNDETPLNSIGMPYYSTKLLSVLPYETYVTEYSPLLQPRQGLDPDLSLAVHPRQSQGQFSRTTGGVFDGGANQAVVYLPNPKKTKRYQVSLAALGPRSFGAGVATARVGSRRPDAPAGSTHPPKRLSIPLFRSEKEKARTKDLGWDKRKANGDQGERDSDETDEVAFKIGMGEHGEMPQWYRQVEIKYSKFGIEDFDFGYYNNSRYSGLETHIVNSYTNSLLQVMYHTFPIRKVAESHVAVACATLNCMLCELGFLFKMLGDARGVNCQTTNFSKSFSINQRAIALELMDHQHQNFFTHSNPILVAHRSSELHQIRPSSMSNRSYAGLIQLCHHFLLDQISEEASKVSPQASLRVNPIDTQVKTTKTSIVPTFSNPPFPPSPIMDIFSTRWQTIQTCSSCQHHTSRTTFTKVIEMIYPRKALSNESKPLTDFCSILKNSMVRDTTAKSSCSNCAQHCHQKWKRYLDDEGLGNRLLPIVLAINAGVTNSEQLEIWVDAKVKAKAGQVPVAGNNNNKQSIQEELNNRFLQPEIGISVEGNPDEGNAGLPRMVIGDNNPIRTPQPSVKYELRGLVVQIQSDDEAPHLVSLVKVQDPVPDPQLMEEAAKGNSARTEKGWYLFNDFLVRKVSEEEALSFPGSWKIPCVLYYVRKDYPEVLDLDRLPSMMDKSILFQDLNLSRCRDVSKIRHEVLTEEELPKKGDLVAIDAEFVSLQQEEVDYKSDGTRIVRRPSRMTLARVSVLRGEGSKTGVPFIDDHIQTFEPVTDYLTEYSGIRPGDLDENVSPHTLVPLKAAYKKLRVLVDLGCIFIGHGLSKDFRIINIHVPPSQIIDTVDLYYIATRQRKLSLRLLSYLILKHDIQNTGMHDSIEDARTALQLYDFSRQLKNEGVWSEELENVYRKGREMGWKVPGADKMRSPLPLNAISGPGSVNTVATSTMKPTNTSSPSMTPATTHAQLPSTFRFTPSTFAASTAVYMHSSHTHTPPAFPPHSAARILPPYPSRLSTHLEHTSPTSVTSSMSTSQPLRSAGHSPSVMNFSTAHPAPQVNPLSSSFSNSSVPPAVSTVPFRQYVNIPPPVFEPRKKPAAGFNPMAPSFVLPSSAVTRTAMSGGHHGANAPPASTLSPGPSSQPMSIMHASFSNSHAGPQHQHHHHQHPQLPQSHTGLYSNEFYPSAQSHTTAPPSHKPRLHHHLASAAAAAAAQEHFGLGSGGVNPGSSENYHHYHHHPSPKLSHPHSLHPHHHHLPPALTSELSSPYFSGGSAVTSATTSGTAMTITVGGGTGGTSGGSGEGAGNLNVNHHHY